MVRILRFLGLNLSKKCEVKRQKKPKSAYCPRTEETVFSSVLPGIGAKIGSLGNHNRSSIEKKMKKSKRKKRKFFIFAKDLEEF
ncbi:MAG: hypothetical protein IJK97_07445 [Thermoguttaceae bacterium]|nr:hypothetical protein [Thermoguttaceae bacterium]